MEAKIIGEDEVDIGTRVVDNNGVEHQVEMHKDGGEVYAHQQDGYPDDPSKRTPEESEHVHQAQWFARYYVKVQKGHDTMPPLVDPDRIDAARRAIEALSPEEFRRLFGGLHRQMASHHDPGVARVIDIPEDAADPDAVFYRLNIFLGIDPAETDVEEEAATLAAEHGLSLEESVADRSLREVDEEEVEAWEAFAEEFSEVAREEGADLSEGTYIDAVSDLHVWYPTPSREMRVTEANDPFDREPDARLELPPVEPGPLDEFQAFLAFTLRCQVRDSFVRMGVEPPEFFRVLGYGRYEAMERYEKLEMYPPLHDPEADLTGWGLQSEDDDGDEDDDGGILGVF